jgi:predicted ATP-binding protein involved in virulence
MTLQTIEIQKLFGQFDYKIELSETDGITILTGPNGYGKTTVLNIIHSLFNQRFFFFQKLNFQKIAIVFSGGQRIELSKGERHLKPQPTLKDINGAKQVIPVLIQVEDINIELFIGSVVAERFIYNSAAEMRVIQQLITRVARFIPVHQLAQNLWMDARTGKQITLRDFLVENEDEIPDRIFNLLKKQENKYLRISEMFDSQHVHIIKEQRLIKLNPLGNTDAEKIEKTIEKYAKELKHIIEITQKEVLRKTQELDNTFPTRLIKCQTPLTEPEFKKRYLQLQEKQKQLKNLGLATVEASQVSEYNDKTANVLTVYLEDSEEKTKVYNDLFSRISLLERMINEKFSFKAIIIDAEKGFRFKTKDGDISLTDLSSGEQQEIVLLYELLFKTETGALILIDEPEISLHVAWQHDVIHDLQKIAEIKKISFFVATHSPQIINGRWELTRDLYDLSKPNSNPQNDPKQPAK